MATKPTDQKTPAEMELELLKTKFAALQAQVAKGSEIRFKVSEKGGVSVYGLHSRFPVTLYYEQWNRLIAKVPELTAFLAANVDKVSRKNKADAS